MDFQGKSGGDTVFRYGIARIAEPITVSKQHPRKCSNAVVQHSEQDEDVLDTWFSSAL